MKGTYAGGGIMLDHVLPRAVVPELAAKFYNLEAVAAKVNLEKSAKVGLRELLNECVESPRAERPVVLRRHELHVVNRIVPPFGQVLLIEHLDCRVDGLDVDGERATIVTARGTRYAFRRRPNGMWGLTLFTAQLLALAERAARECGYAVLMGHTERDIHREQMFFDQVSAGRADGVILVSSSDAQAIATRFNIRSIPTLIAFRGGREIARQSGALPLSTLLQWARQAVA